MTNYNFDTCRISYGEIQENSQICAGDLYGGKDTCQGDLLIFRSIYLNTYIL